MKNIYTWAANPAKRTVTVGDIIEAKGKKILTPVSYTHLTLPTITGV